MLGQHLTLCAIVLLFVMGVKKVEPLKCFSCEYKTLGKYENGTKACKDLYSSDTDSELLIECDSATTSCFNRTAQFSKRANQTPTHLWKRSCYNEEKFKDSNGCKDTPFSGSVKGSGTDCFCRTDACNVPDKIKEK